MRAEKAITVKPETGFGHGWCIKSDIKLATSRSDNRSLAGGATPNITSPVPTPPSPARFLGHKTRDSTQTRGQNSAAGSARAIQGCPVAAPAPVVPSGVQNPGLIVSSETAPSQGRSRSKSWRNPALKREQKAPEDSRSPTLGCVRASRQGGKRRAGGLRSFSFTSWGVRVGGKSVSLFTSLRFVALTQPKGERGSAAIPVLVTPL